MVNCCVVGCNNSRKNSSATMHKFPNKVKEPQRYKAWRNRINRKNLYPNVNHVVCSAHFEEDDFENDLMRTLLPDDKISYRKYRGKYIKSVQTLEIPCNRRFLLEIFPESDEQRMLELQFGCVFR